MIRALLVISILAMITSCKGEEKLSPRTETLGRATGPVSPQKSADHPPMPAAMAMAPPASASDAAPKIHTGQVLETIDASRYTYVRFQKQSGEEVWAAIPKTKLEVGRPVEIVESLVMTNFESKTLNRTFPSVIFGVPRDTGAAPME